MADRLVAAERTVAATPAEVFALVTDPRQHVELDGSGMLQAVDQGAPTRLELGARFGVAMKMGARYRVSNEVVEYDEGRLIAWQVHPSGPFARLREWLVGGNRWRYELATCDEGTRVTETFDWSGAHSAWMIRLLGFPRRNVNAIDRTLDGISRRFSAADESRP